MAFLPAEIEGNRRRKRAEGFVLEAYHSYPKVGWRLARRLVKSRETRVSDSIVKACWEYANSLEFNLTCESRTPFNIQQTRRWWKPYGCLFGRWQTGQNTNRCMKEVACTRNANSILISMVASWILDQGELDNFNWFVALFTCSFRIFRISNFFI